MILNNDCGVSSLPTNYTIGVTYTPLFYFNPTGVGLAEFNNLGCEFNAVLAATITIVTNNHENKNKNIFESGALWAHNNNKNNNNSKDNTHKNDKNGSNTCTKKQLTSDKERSIMYREYRSKVHFSLAYLLRKYKSQYKDFENAKYHFEIAIELEQFYATYRMFYEFLWHDMDNHSESEIQYKVILKFTKDSEDIYFSCRLLLRDHLHKYELAIEQFEKALELVPNDNEAEEELEYTKKFIKT